MRSMVPLLSHQRMVHRETELFEERSNPQGFLGSVVGAVYSTYGGE
jgi:hypothetical protein